MSTRTDFLDPAELLWVRGLAASLVRQGAGDPDDLAQETLLTLLRRPPLDGRPLRPWLACVLRNVARGERRSERGRRERERLAARAEAVASHDELVARTELHRAVVDEVLALPEPQREVVLLRYFEELSTAEIAQRCGLPAGTVRSHLSRSRRTLRARLQARHGGELPLAGLALLAGPRLDVSAATGAAPSLVPTWITMQALKVGGGVLAAALVVVGAQQWMQSPDTARGPAAVQPAAGALDLEGSAEPLAGGAAPDRAPAPAEESSELPDEPDLAPAPPRPSAAEVAREAEAIALETLDKSLQIAQAYELALSALAAADPSAGERQPDGSRVFAVYEDGELGTATLRVLPGDPDRAGAFMLRFDGPSTLGLPGDFLDAQGSKLELRFGLGAGTIGSFGSWSEVRFASDPRGEPYSGDKVRIGGFLVVSEDEVNWRSQTLEPESDEAGATLAVMRYGHPEAPAVGSLADGRSRELAAALERFAPR